MDEFLEDEGKLGHVFMLADALEEVDIGDGDRPRLMFPICWWMLLQGKR